MRVEKGGVEGISFRSAEVGLFFPPFPEGIRKYRTKGMGGAAGYWREKGSTRAYLLKREKGMTQMRRSGNVVLKNFFFPLLQKAFDRAGQKLENRNVRISIFW